MQVRYATATKAIEASNKHFNGELNLAQMTSLASMIIRKAEYVGKSDRANAGHTVARIVWATINGTMFAVVLDGKDIAKGIATVVSIYDVHNVSVKAKRFNMKKVG